MVDIERLDKEREESLKLITKRWVTFFNKFKQIEKLEIHEWKPVHLLAYFDRKYRETFNKNFAYSLNGSAPSKCTEIVLIKRLFSMLYTSSQREVKEYIDWVFENKIAPKKVQIRSVGFLLSGSFVNEFRHYIKEKNRITRSTELPDHYAERIKDMNLPINTYGDLAFAKIAYDTASDTSMKELYEELFYRLRSVGFEYEMLEEIK